MKLFLACILAFLVSGITGVEILVGFKQGAFEFSFEEAVVNAHMPSSSFYGSSWTVEELESIFGTTSENLDAMQKIVERYGGASKIHGTRDYLRVSIPDESAASRFLKQDFADYDVVLMQRLGSPYPGQNRAPLGVTRFAAHQSRATSDTLLVATPKLQREVYDVQDVQPIAAEDGVYQMTWGTGTFGVDPKDLMTMFDEFDVPARTSSMYQPGYPGEFCKDNAGEATLDATNLMMIAPGIDTVVYNTDNDPDTEWSFGFGPALLAFTSDLASFEDADLPAVLSMSLGSVGWKGCSLMCEEVAKSSSVSYETCLNYASKQRQVCMYEDEILTTRINAEFLKLAARRVTVLGATGDGGSHFSFIKFPEEPIGHELNEAACKLNLPTFPAESPWVTGVGGIEAHLINNATTLKAWNPTGAGFSWQFERHPYADYAVNNHTRQANMPPADAYAASGRAYPDIAGFAENVPMYFCDRLLHSGGTSASTPAVAGLFSALNNQRAALNKPSLGFLNPGLYYLASTEESYQKHFTDITDGHSNCDVRDSCCDNGFEGSKGWDPITGLGVPRYNELLKTVVEW